MLANNFLVAAQAVLPIFIIMGVGILIRHLGIVDEAEVKKINKLNFMVFSSAAACFTMFLWIFALKSMGMF